MIKGMISSILGALFVSIIILVILHFAGVILWLAGMLVAGIIIAAVMLLLSLTYNTSSIFTGHLEILVAMIIITVSGGIISFLINGKASGLFIVVGCSFGVGLFFGIIFSFSLGLCYFLGTISSAAVVYILNIIFKKRFIVKAIEWLKAEDIRETITAESKS